MTSGLYLLIFGEQHTAHQTKVMYRQRFSDDLYAIKSEMFYNLKFSVTHILLYEQMDFLQRYFNYTMS